MRMKRADVRRLISEAYEEKAQSVASEALRTAALKLEDCLEELERAAWSARAFDDAGHMQDAVRNAQEKGADLLDEIRALKQRLHADPLEGY